MKLVSLLLLTQSFAFAQSSIADVQIERTSEDGYTGAPFNASAVKKADGLVAMLRESEDWSADAPDRPEALIMREQPLTVSGGDNLQDRDPSSTPRSRPVNSSSSTNSIRSADEIDRVFTRSSGSGFVLRCWQEGRLILQRNVARMPRLEREAVQLDAADGVQLQLFDLQNAMCMVQKRQ
jgi:hypothetical protein